MAKKTNLIVEIGGKVGSSFKKSIRETQRSVSSLSKNVSRTINDTAAGAAKGFKNVIRSDAFQGAAVAAGGLALAMRKAVKTAADFESGMLKVKAVTGATGKDFKALQAKAKEMGASTKFTASEAAAGMEFLARAGYTTNQILESTGPLLSAASAEGMELGTVSDIVSNIVGSNKMLVSDTAQIADTLAQTSRKANVNIASLGESFKAIGPTGANAGLSLQELSASFGVLGDSGIKGAEAGTALRNVLVRLSAPPTEAAKALSKLGVATKDANGDLKPMETILGDLSGKMKALNLGSAEQADVLSKVFGLRALAAGQVLMEANANGKLAEKIGQVNNHQGAAADMSATMMAGFEGQMTLMQSAMDGLMVSLGTPLLKPLVAVMQALAGIAKPIGDLLTDMPILATVVGIASAAFIGFVAVLPIIGALSGGLMAVTGAATAGAGAMMLLTSPITLTIAGIIGLIAIFSLLYNRVDWFKNAVDGTIKFLGNAWNVLSTGISSLWSSTMDNAGNTVNSFGQVWNAVTGGIAAVWNTVTTGISAAWDATVNALMPTIEAFKQIFAGAFQYIKGIFQVFWGIFTGDSQMAVDGVSNIFGGLKNVFGGIVDGIRASWDLVSGIVQGVATNIVATLTALPGQLVEIGESIISGFGAIWTQLSTIVQGVAAGIVATFVALPGQLLNVGGAIIDTIREGFMSRFNALKDTVVKSFKELRKLLPFSDAKKGPFKDLTASGRAIVTTLAQGVRDREGVLKNALGDTAALAMTGMGPAFAPIGMGGPALALPGGGSFSSPSAAPKAAPKKSRGDDGNGVFGFLNKLLPVATALIPGAGAFGGMAKAGLNIGEELIHGGGLNGINPMQAAATLAPVVNVSVNNSDATAEDIARVVTTQLEQVLADAEADQRASLND